MQWREFIYDIVHRIVFKSMGLTCLCSSYAYARSLSFSFSPPSLSLSVLASLGGIPMNIRKEKKVGSKVSMGASDQIQDRR